MSYIFSRFSSPSCLTFVTFRAFRTYRTLHNKQTYYIPYLHTHTHTHHVPLVQVVLYAQFLLALPVLLVVPVVKQE